MNQTAEEILKSKLDFRIRLENNPDYTFNKVLEAMEEYANQSKWISVEDELPERGQAVIVGNIKVGTVYNSLYYQINGEWYDLKTHMSGITVTHYQLLPELPPKIN